MVTFHIWRDIEPFVDERESGFDYIGIMNKYTDKALLACLRHSNLKAFDELY